MKREWSEWWNGKQLYSDDDLHDQEEAEEKNSLKETGEHKINANRSQRRG